MQKKIIVLGGINQDLVITTPRFPKIGESLIGSGFVTVWGGKGANQAVAAARLGGSVALIGAVGDDAIGQAMTAGFAAQGIDTAYVKTIPGTPTGTAVITLYNGDNFIIVDPGANDAVTPAQLDEAEPLFRDASMLVTQMEIPKETVTHAIRLAKKHGLTVLLNPAPATALDPSVLQSVDILTPNETECAAITGVKTETIQNAKDAIAILHRQGVRQVIVTMGAQGAVYSDANGQIAHAPAFAASPVVDTTAAGDCFSAALAVALTEGRRIGEAVIFASAASSVSVTRKGAQPSLPTRAEAEARIKEGSPCVC